MTKKKCRVYYKKDKSHCNAAAFTSIKVNLIHSDTGRKSKQTWPLCKEHFADFMDVEGKEWEAIYPTKPNKRALVTGFQILDGLDYGYRS